jgi:hypothetical protein
VKRPLVLALSLSLGLGAAACADTTGPGGALAGTYTLQTVNGFPLPAVVQNNAALYSEVVAAQIVLEANGNYSGLTRYRDTYPGQLPVLVDDNTTGYWTLSGNQITLTQLRYSNDPSYGTVSSNRLTLHDLGFTLVYTR